MRVDAYRRKARDRGTVDLVAPHVGIAARTPQQVDDIAPGERADRDGAQALDPQRDTFFRSVNGRVVTAIAGEAGPSVPAVDRGDTVIVGRRRLQAVVDPAAVVVVEGDRHRKFRPAYRPG